LEYWNIGEVILQNTCSYHIKQAMIFKTLREKSVENENLIYKELICAVDLQHKAKVSIYTIFVMIDNACKIRRIIFIPELLKILNAVVSYFTNSLF